ncbi:cell division protein FtsL [Shimia ponticola]|uniref:cell division protein FtsL n=1 Tax=Shimia ponticola TaxID=2582893 RepID=UPI0011BD4FFF|nr:cell division protein FtsL [Shimia ponticola]
MKTLLLSFAAIVVIALATWAYSENYATQASIAKVEKLHRDIASARSRLGVLKAEWAYLNRPDRLRDLAELNFDKLGLLPLAPDQFGSIDQVAFPTADLMITDAVEVMDRSLEEEDRP